MPILDTPTIDYMPSFVEALREGFTLGTHESPYSKEKIDAIANDPVAFLDDYLHPKEDFFLLPDGNKTPRIPQTVLWYTDNNEFIGRLNIRHYLDDALLNHGGHIAYHIRPSKQNQGHASNMLKKGLAFSKENLGLDKVLFVIAADNIASIKVVEKSGGIMEDSRIDPFDHVTNNRYWIML